MNVEGGRTAREDVREAMQSILQELASRAKSTLRDDFVRKIWHDSLAYAGSQGAFKEVLIEWAEADPRPLVLLIDEIDALVGDALLSVLRQLCSGYDRRPKSFPHSVVLCGVRDLRDYRIHSGADGKEIAGASAFNSSADSLRLGDLTHAEVPVDPAHFRDGTGIRTRSSRKSLDPDMRPAVARQRTL